MNEERNLVLPSKDILHEEQNNVDLNDPKVIQDHYRLWFVGDKFNTYYKAHFDHIDNQKAISGFNLPAFFLGPIWLFYRKMYAYGFIYIGFVLVLAVFVAIFGISQAFDLAISIGLSIAMGLIGNTLYRTFVDRKIMKIKKIPAFQIAKMKEEFGEQGGTNVIVAWLLFILIVFLTTLDFWLQS